MSLSPEVQAQADEIRRNKSLVKSLQAERDLWRSKAMDAQGQLDTLAGKREMSPEDREELKRQAAELDALNDELEGAAQDNTKPEPVAGGQSGAAPADTPAKVEPEPIPDDAGAARPDPMPGTARGDGAPLMPNMAFDPDPTGNKGKGDAGQPNQAQAIETPGGFVVSGGGSTQRAPGSDPASPSSTLVVPEDPNAKAAANNADLAKSGLGDSSKNAELGNDGQPISSGTGIVSPPTDAEREAAQKQQDKVAEEMARREENPLNLAPAGTPQAGSAEAEKAAQERRDEERRQAQDAERQRSDAQQGKPDPGTPGPDPVSGPTDDFTDERAKTPA